MGGAVGDWLTVWTSEFVLTDLIGNVVPMCADCHSTLHVSGLSRLAHELGHKLTRDDLALYGEAWGETFKKKRPGEYADIVVAIAR
jgi:hypothetical protein